MTLSDSTCASSIAYTVVKSDGTPIPNPPFTFDSSILKLTTVSLTDSSITGSHNLKYRATNTHSIGTVFSEDVFTVSIGCDLVSSYSGPFVFSYKISDPALIIDLFTASYSGYCLSAPISNTITYSAKLIDGSNIPLFMAFNALTRQLTVHSLISAHALSYDIMLIGTLNDG